MAKLLAVYTLGRKGVNLVKSPTHLDDDELRVAQNVALSLDRSLGGLPMRGGLQALTAAPLAGAVRAGVDLPLADPSTRQRWLYFALGPGGGANTWIRSNDGTTWTAVATPSRPTSEWPATHLTGVRQAASLGGLAYVASDNYIKYPDAGQERPPLHRWDLAAEVKLFSVPWSPIIPVTNPFWIQDLCVHRGALYLAIHDQPGGGFRRGRVLAFDPSANSLSQVGPEFGEFPGEQPSGDPLALVSFGGRLFVSTYQSAGTIAGKVFSIQPLGDTTWTSDLSTGTHGYVTSMASFGGKLYGGCQSRMGTDPAIVLRRDGRGNWVSSLTGSVNWAVFGPLVVFDGRLFAAHVDIIGPTVSEIWQYDGASWTLALNVGATYGVRRAGPPLIWRGALYWPWIGTGATRGANADGFLLRRAVGGPWTAVATNVALHGSGFAVEV
jgi:hypothetical protein